MADIAKIGTVESSTKRYFKEFKKVEKVLYSTMVV